MLVDPPIAIVGLSNWALDSSKMNRAVCLQRPEATAEDIMFTGQNIVGDASASALSGSNNRLQQWLVNLSNAFHKLNSNQELIFGTGTR